MNLKHEKEGHFGEICIWTSPKFHGEDDSLHYNDYINYVQSSKDGVSGLNHSFVIVFHQATEVCPN